MEAGTLACALVRMRLGVAMILRRLVLIGLVALGTAGLSCDRTESNSTTNIAGPFGNCTTIFLNNQPLNVTARIRDPITIDGITYTVNPDCSVTKIDTTTTTTGTTGP